jgi:probable HAF family extracellular repeat protein
MRTWLAAAAVMAAGAVGARGAEFHGIGSLPGGFSYSFVQGISGDGSTVVGQSIGLNGYEAFRWTRYEGIVGLGDLPGSQFDSVAFDASYDGRVIVGSGRSDNRTEAFRWTAEGGMVNLGRLAGFASSEGSAVSADGTVVAGANSATGGTLTGGSEAYLWTPTSGMVGLGNAGGAQNRTSAFGLSGDGRVAAGDAQWGEPSEISAAAWMEGEGLRLLNRVPGSIAFAVSGDGQSIVGRSADRATLWTLDGTERMLGALPSLIGQGSQATDVSYDGRFVVGDSVVRFSGGYDTGREAFIWDEDHGMRALRDALASDYGLTIPNGWILSSANSISFDGTAIAGFGVDPQGERQGWVVYVPEPGTSLIFLSLALGLGRRQR